MADRKVLVRYYPPDFDPQKLREKSREIRRRFASTHVGPRPPRPPKMMNVRFMFPFTLCCDGCSEFVYIGTKFNARVERAVGEEYLGVVPVWRFHGRCPHCRHEFVFRSDPQHTDYVLEQGGTRAYDPRRDVVRAENAARIALQEEISTDQVRALEEKSNSVANEIAATQAIDELRRINRRLLFRETAVDEALEWLQSGGIEEPIEELTEAELEELAEARAAISERQVEQLFEGGGRVPERGSGLSPGHGGGSPRHIPAQSPGHSPRHSPGHSPRRSSGHSPGHSPGRSPRHSSGHSPGHSPGPSPRPCPPVKKARILGNLKVSVKKK